MYFLYKDYTIVFLHHDSSEEKANNKFKNILIQLHPYFLLLIY